MSGPWLPAILAEEEVLRWKTLPPTWVLGLLVVPLGCLLVFLAYRLERGSPPRRAFLGLLRLAALLAVAFLVFGPFYERKLRRKVRSHLAVLVDASASMAVKDTPSEASAAALAGATGLPASRLGDTTRLALVRAALTKGGESSVLEDLRRRFVTHVYSFASEPRTAWSGDEDRPGEDPALAARVALERIEPTGTSTRLGDSVAAMLEDFRLRDEPLAGILVFSDGRQTGGTLTPREAGERARNFAQKNSAAARGVPVIAVTAGDPSSSRNVQVRNLVAPEVVLVNDDAAFEFDVVSRGFDGKTGLLRLTFMDPPGENVLLTPGEVTLRGGESGTHVKARYRFTRPGTYRVRVGVPPLREERVTEDNYLPHLVRVVDRKVKVLLVDGYPRREFEFLGRALTRDVETMLAHTLNLESAGDTPQFKTEAPGWPELKDRRFPRDRADLFAYDVVILGDVDWRKLDDTEEEARRRLEDLRDFVEAGGGLLCVSGKSDMPRSYRRSPLAEVLPVVVDADEELRTRQDETRGWNLLLTPEGRESPILRIDDDAERSRALWESAPWSAQYWYFPVLRASAGARVLAVHPLGAREGDAGGSGHGNRFGPHALVAVKPFGLGRCLWVGVDEMWRLRFGASDRFFYRYYATAIRYLASYRLLGGNRRVKVHPERKVYFLDDPVTILANVVGEDYRPPSPREKPTVKAIVTLPDRREEVLELAAVPPSEREGPLGLYRGTFTAVVEGTYAVAPDRSEVPDETPEAESFLVQSSAEERKDPSVDEESLRALAAASGGTALPLADVRKAAEMLKPRDFEVPVEARPDPLLEHWWVAVAVTLILALEWILRKRWRLL